MTCAPGRPTAAMLARMTRAARGSASMSSARAAPRDSASRPTAPDPAYRSSTRAPLREPRTEVTAAKSPSLARSLVGRVRWPAGTASRRPRACPAMTRVMAPVCPPSGSGLVEELGPPVAEQVADRRRERGITRQPGVLPHDDGRLLARLPDQVLVAEQAQQLQAGPAACLRGAEHVALPPLLEVEP